MAKGKVAANSGKQQDGRRAPGRPFKPGQSGNPSGRPKVEGFIRELAQRHGPEALQTLVELLRSGKEPIRLGAAEALLNRGYGRPAQAVELAGPDGGSLVFSFTLDKANTRIDGDDAGDG